MSSQPKTKHLLSEYKPAPFRITHADLVIKIFDDRTEVSSSLSIVRQSDAGAADLVLNGTDLTLLQVRINGQNLDQAHYSASDKALTVKTGLDEFTLETVCNIFPGRNLSLEGIYQSQGTVCSQCEAEGFRRVTYYYDRPDIMATFRVRLEGDKEKFPVLLSNGHCTGRGELPESRHYAVWDDPFPKPCYLFAVVAGQLAALEDSFTTRSGKKVRLSIYSREDDINKCHHAMDCLKKAMAWDESVFDLECDLNHYQIVAISDFNMGAMENKGLNIFNSSLVLANQDIAMDSAYQDIMAVIGHEYFHNWTGNRVTCRDWFQLCLKEGLTVFRDQEFSGDMYSAPVKRIEEIKLLRQFQWPEDDGPMSHPPRPDNYEEINNFYTATVYNKGAEVVRILQTLISKPAFYKGMKLYFERHDGQAVTQEDFVDAMATASGMDLSQFFLWYSESGTPTVTVDETYNPGEQTYSLLLRQEIKGTDGIPKAPRVIPIRTALLGSEGEELSFRTDPSASSPGKEATLIMTEADQTFKFFGVREKPVPSLFRNMSAPVKVRSFLKPEDHVFLMSHDTDPVNVWDAGQTLYQDTLMTLTDQFREQAKPEIPEGIISAFGSVLKNQSFDNAFKALALKMPPETLLASQAAEIDPQAIHAASTHMIRTLAEAHKEALLSLYESLNKPGGYSHQKEAMGERSLKNTCLQYLSALPGSPFRELICRQYEHSDNMTDRITALTLLNHHTPEYSSKYLTDFYETWQNEEQAIDHWFSLQASRPTGHPGPVRDLMHHPAFRLENPNRMRSVLSVFCYRNLTGFHSPDGAGYKIATDTILKLDGMNRQMAAHVCKAFNSWRKMKSPCRHMMEKALKELQAHGGLSPDVNEVLSKFLSPA